MINVNNVFDFIPPTMEEMYGYMAGMDMSSSSCIDEINMKICKNVLDAIPSNLRH